MGDVSEAKERLRLFLSYGHREEAIARRIYEHLEGRGHDVFFDQSDIRFGDDWRERIADEARSSNGVVACLSKYAFRDGGVCRDEISIAVGVRGGNVHTLLLDPEAEVSPPYVLTHRQWLDMSSWRRRMGEGEDSFEPWFEARMAELDRVLESPDSARFQGDITAIANRLGVLPDDSRQASLLGSPLVGREWLAEEVEAWLNDRSSERVCLLTGGPGLGKSAFAAHMAHWGSRLVGRVVASVFCARGFDAYNDPRAVVRSLAYALACRIPQYRGALRGILERDVDLGMDAWSLLRALVAEPLFSRSVDGGGECVCIVVDGIDEAGGPEANALAEVVARCARELPCWVKVLVTSREVDAATAPFAGVARRVSVEGSDGRNMGDVAAYLHSSLGSFSSEDGFEENVERIARASEGAFLYAKLMADAVRDGKVSLGRAADAAPEGLPALFREWFRWTFPDAAEFRSRWRGALGCVASAPGGALPESELAVLFGWDWDEVDDFLRIAGALVERRDLPVGGEAVRVSHAFVADWLSSREAGEYRCDRRAALALMGRRYHGLATEGVDRLSDWEAVSLARILDAAGMGRELDRLWEDGAVARRCMGVASGQEDGGALTPALDVYMELRRASDEGHRLPDGTRAEVLNNLGLLLHATGRMAEAEGAWRESLDIRRSLAGSEPTAFLPDVATSLNNLGELLRDTDRATKADESFRLANEAERLSKEAAEGHADISSLLEEIDALLM